MTKTAKPVSSPLPKSTNLKKDKLPRGITPVIFRKLTYSEYDAIWNKSIWSDYPASPYELGYMD